MGVHGILIYELFYCLISDSSDMELFHAEFIATFFYSLVYSHIFKNLSKLIQNLTATHKVWLRVPANSTLTKFPNKKTSKYYSIYSLLSHKIKT